MAEDSAAKNGLSSKRNQPHPSVAENQRKRVKQMIQDQIDELKNDCGDNWDPSVAFLAISAAQNLMCSRNEVECDAVTRFKEHLLSDYCDHHQETLIDNVEDSQRKLDHRMWWESRQDSAIENSKNEANRQELLAMEYPGEDIIPETEEEWSQWYHSTCVDEANIRARTRDNHVHEDDDG